MAPQHHDDNDEDSCFCFMFDTPEVTPCPASLSSHRSLAIFSSASSSIVLTPATRQARDLFSYDVRAAHSQAHVWKQSRVTPTVPACVPLLLAGTSASPECALS